MSGAGLAPGVDFWKTIHITAGHFCAIFQEVRILEGFYTGYGYSLDGVEYATIDEAWEAQNDAGI